MPDTLAGLDPLVAPQIAARRLTYTYDACRPDIVAAADGELSPVQQAFKDCHGLQCGFCTPGFLTTITAGLRDNPDPTRDEAREMIAGNLCRCTGYQNIVASVLRAVRPSWFPATPLPARVTDRQKSDDLNGNYFHQCHGREDHGVADVRPFRRRHLGRIDQNGGVAGST